jgi:hypothetical protein
MLLPLTFPAYASIQDASGPPINVIESDFNSEQTASFVSWRTENGLHHTAVGSSKGSINVFSFYPTNAPNSDFRARLTVTLPSEHNPPTAPSSSPSHSRRHSRSLQSPSSLSFNQALINVSARARVVSGVSHEQVEAPKNYVDFEDEPERLKDILRSNSKHKRTLADSILPSFDRGVVIEQSPGPASPTLLPILPNSPSGAASTSKNKDDPRSLLSATNSPTFPLGPLSAPSSPRQLSPHFDGSPSRGTVKASIILDSCGPGHAASAMRYIETVDLLVVLQESGCVLSLPTYIASPLSLLVIYLFLTCGTIRVWQHVHARPRDHIRIGFGNGRPFGWCLRGTYVVLLLYCASTKFICTSM